MAREKEAEEESQLQLLLPPWRSRTSLPPSLPPTEKVAFSATFLPRFKSLGWVLTTVLVNLKDKMLNFLLVSIESNHWEMFFFKRLCLGESRTGPKSWLHTVQVWIDRGKRRFDNNFLAPLPLNGIFPFFPSESRKRQRKKWFISRFFCHVISKVQTLKHCCFSSFLPLSGKSF